MVAIVPNPQQIRVPNAPIEQLTDEKGYPTPSTQTFLYTLITSLQQNFGDEGLVAPSQAQDATTTPASDYISQIQNNTVIDAQGNQVYTLQPGTFLYDSTNDRILVSILVGGVPLFREIPVIVPVPPIP